MVIWEPVVTTKNCLWRRTEGEGRERRKREVKKESYV